MRVHRGALLLVLTATLIWTCSARLLQPYARRDAVCLESVKNTTADPLCASNGQTFHNFLAFRCYTRFFNVRGLTVRHGACAASPQPDHCALSFVVWRRVCGSDNRTYSSAWELMCEAQSLAKPTTVQYDGPCRIRCSVALRYDPVCGSDGVTYPNVEALRCASLRDSNITLNTSGPCEEKSTSHCIDARKFAFLGREVCASNGITYPSLSALLCLRQYNTDLKILHDGRCKLADVPELANPVRICLVADNQALWIPVCGSNGETFPNPFVFQCAKDREEIPKSVTIEYEGPCQEPSSPPEPPDPCEEMNPVVVIDNPLLCASDGRTYYSSQQYLCAVKKHGSWFNYSITRIGAPCDAADHPCERLRLESDALISAPVCANDGMTYSNPLALMCAMYTDPNLRQHHNGECLVPNKDNSDGDKVSETPDEETASVESSTKYGGNENDNSGNDENSPNGDVLPGSAEVENIS